MSDTSGGANLNAPHATDDHFGASTRTTHCAICGRRMRWTVYRVVESESLPERPQSWTLCQGCHEAVVRQLRKQPVRNQFRLRVAVGLVASERAKGLAPTPQFEERLWEWIFPVTLLVTMAIHIAFALVIFIAR